MKAKEVRNWQKEHFSKDAEAHVESSSEELEKYLDKELNDFWRAKGVKLAKKIKSDREKA